MVDLKSTDKANFHLEWTKNKKESLLNVINLSQFLMNNFLKKRRNSTVNINPQSRAPTNHVQRYRKAHESFPLVSVL